MTLSAPVVMFVAGTILGSGIGARAGWALRARRLRPGPAGSAPVGTLELAEQRRILVEACQAVADQVRGFDTALWEHVTDALSAAGADRASQ